MTTVEMRSRVMAQLFSFPRGQDRTADEIASGMVGLTGHDIEPTLEMFRTEQLAVRIRPPGGRGKARWRLA